MAYRFNSLSSDFSRQTLPPDHIPPGSTDTWNPGSLDTAASQSVASSAVMRAFRSIVQERQLCSIAFFNAVENIGMGGEGHVFRALRQGTDGFSTINAVKIYSPAIYETIEAYDESMRRIGAILSTIVDIQHDHLVGVLHFTQQEGVRFMVMEWIHGFDLASLMSHMKDNVSSWQMGTAKSRHMSESVVARNNGIRRFTSGTAIHLVRQCLSGLGALHRRGVVHGDIKLSNLMLNRTGSLKVIDIGSAASFYGSASTSTSFTPRFAAPEILTGAPPSPQSDLASVGYVLITLRSGQCPFSDLTTLPAHYDAKQRLSEDLGSVLPDDVCRCDALLWLCKSLVTPDCSKRLQSAEEASAACEDVHRSLVQASLDCDYGASIRRWMENVLF